MKNKLLNILSSEVFVAAILFLSLPTILIILVLVFSGTTSEPTRLHHRALNCREECGAYLAIAFEAGSGNCLCSAQEPAQ